MSRSPATHFLNVVADMIARRISMWLCDEVVPAQFGFAGLEELPKRGLDCCRRGGMTEPAFYGVQPIARF